MPKRITRKKFVIPGCGKLEGRHFGIEFQLRSGQIKDDEVIGLNVKIIYHKMKRKGQLQHASDMVEKLTSSSAFPSVGFLKAVQDFVDTYPDFLTAENLKAGVRTAIFALWQDHMKKLRGNRP